tara:strand:- start:221 stop:661 length:441 start_codon:yes stop_codon:yes gene_type:complete
MYTVNYFFEDTHPIKHQLPAKKWIKKCLKRENYSDGILNFIFCSDMYLIKIHKKYLNKDYETDVISFKNEIPKHLRSPATENCIFGDIFISIDTVKKNKKTYKSLLKKEIKRVMIHGALHLIGYNDISPKDKKIMRQKENLYINLI